MSRKTAASIVLLGSFHLIMATGCAAKRVYGSGGRVAQVPSGFIEARVLPAVTLRTTESPAGQSGKITGMENRLVYFLPAPYWNIEALKIDIADIVQIAVPGKGLRVGRAAAYGFGLGVIIVGGIAGASSEYDEDYQWALVGAGAGGVTGAAVMSVAAALSGSRKEQVYDLASMSDEEKTYAILKLMGIKR